MTIPWLKRCLACLVVVTVMEAVSAHAQTVLFVDANSAGPGHDGSSWCEAFLDLQSGLDVATAGGTIRMANGVYTPDPAGLADSHEATFRLKNGVTIEGGYAGCGAPNPDARDTTLFETILSGDLDGNDDPNGASGAGGNCCFDLTPGPGCSDAACEATVCAIDAQCCADVWNGPCQALAAQFCCDLCADNVTKCDNTFHVVTGSAAGATTVLDGVTVSAGYANGDVATGFGLGADSGGGLRIDGGSPTVRDCTFVDNWARNRGGGMFVRGLSGSSIDRCRFEGNEADLGGGLVVFSNGVTISRCTFIRNVAVNGGGMEVLFGAPTVNGCVFLGNEANNIGGGMASSGDAKVINCLFSGNSGGGDGGGLYTTFESDPTITNCTFVQNTALRGSGIRIRSGNPTLTNCILWGNLTSDESDQILIHADGTVTMNYSALQGYSGALGGIGNIGANPMFIDPLGPDNIAGTEDDDFRLSSNSPCIDAGDNDAPLLPVTDDLDGNARFVDFLGVPDSGNGTAPIVDMGPYEKFNDCNGNGVPDYSEGDADGDGLIDACDDCTDTDGDGHGDPGYPVNTCPLDGCPGDPNKSDPGICGCGVDDNADGDGDGVPDCTDQCSGVDDAIFAPECVAAIPTASTWGLIVLAILLLVVSKIAFRKPVPMR